ncbi:MAG: methylthioribulose 1-phosphate dehydratase [Cyanobacteriota bacterium]|nr:methylthioribulose 1-phosphate dehydratase [Cyanobacteriota bacterium]
MTLSSTLNDRLLAEGPVLCQVIQDIHRRGWCDGTGGNFSSLLNADPMCLLMAPSGVDKGSLHPADLIVVDGSGQVMVGKGKASAETLLHLTILTTTNAKAVLHTHSQAATLLSRHPTISPLVEAVDASLPALLGYLQISGLEMLKGLEGIQTHNASIAIPIIDNCQDMTLLSQAAHPYVDKAPHGLLIAGHGLYAWGDSLLQARRHLEILEFLLEQHWRASLFNCLLTSRQANPQ